MASVRIGNIEIGTGMPKICAPVLGRTEEEILTAAREAEACKADLFEFRADWYEEALHLEKTLALTACVREVLKNRPLLFTFRTADEGGEAVISEQDYQQINEAVIRERLADLVDIELFMGEELLSYMVEKARRQGIFIVASNHDFEGTPDREEILKRLKQMDLLGADILKLAVLPQSKRDVLRIMEATLAMKEEYTEKPLITMAMGEEGVLSRMAGEFFGSAVTFGSLKQSSAPGQIPVADLKKALFYLHTDRKKNLFFIGFMGAGKSTIAANIARLLQTSYIEMDEEIELLAQMPITRIFEERGEECFRDMESRLLNEIIERDKSIVSCGGGIVLRTENVKNMKKGGQIIYLKAEAETIYERVRDCSSRPVLNGNMNVESIRSLMEKREALYEETADFVIKTDGKNINQISEEILVRLLNI